MQRLFFGMECSCDPGGVANPGKKWMSDRIEERTGLGLYPVIGVTRFLKRRQEDNQCPPPPRDFPPGKEIRFETSPASVTIYSPFRLPTASH